MAEAVWFLIKVSTELLSISMIVYKGEMNAGVLIGMIFLGCPQGFGLLVGALHFKLD